MHGRRASPAAVTHLQQPLRSSCSRYGHLPRCVAGSCPLTASRPMRGLLTAPHPWWTGSGVYRVHNDARNRTPHSHTQHTRAYTLAYTHIRYRSIHARTPSIRGQHTRRACDQGRAGGGGRGRALSQYSVDQSASVAAVYDPPPAIPPVTGPSPGAPPSHAPATRLPATVARACQHRRSRHRLGISFEPAVHAAHCEHVLATCSSLRCAVAGGRLNTEPQRAAESLLTLSRREPPAH